MKLFTILSISFLGLFNLTPAFGKRIYVNQAATGAGNGTSWANAYTTIPLGFTNSIVGDTIWVAAGVYKPVSSTATFLVPSGVLVYGSFAGTESNLSQRNIAANPTIMSGDVGAVGVASDNCQHVVVMANVSSATRLDGFKIIDGYTYVIGGSITDGGGGIRITNSSPTIANCTFLENYSYMRGGAIYQQDGGNVTILNCEFGNNSTGNDVNSMGGAIFFNSGILTMKDCKFYSNSSIRGGGLATYSTTVSIDRSSFSGNLTNSSQGGAMYIGDLSSFTVYNSLYVGNVAKTTGAAAYFSSSFNEQNQSFINCTFSGNKNLASSSAIMHANKYSRFSNCIFWDNIASEQIYTAILPTKPIVNYSIVQGGLDFGINIFDYNPLFVSPGTASNAPFTLDGLNYSLKDSSYAINNAVAGYVNANYNFDIDNTARIKQGYPDMGAYETNSTSNLFYTIATSSDPVNAGTFIGNGTFPRGTGFFDVTAKPKSGYKFIYWSEGADTISYDTTYVDLLIRNFNLVAHFTLATSVKETSINKLKALYPNPANGVINVEVASKSKSNIEVKIYDVLGNLIESGAYLNNAGNNTIRINTYGYKKGNYLIQLEDEEGMITEKFIVQ